MLIKLALALVGGTVLSFMFGYLVAYWRDIGRGPSKQLDDKNWLKFFEALTRLKREAFTFSKRSGQQRRQHSSTQRTQQQQRRSRAPSSWEQHPELARLLLKFDDFYPELYRYFEGLQKRGDELMLLEAKELEKTLKTRVSASMMADRLHELLELKAFDNLGVQNLGGEAARQLWMCFSVGHIYLDDARLGSPTLSQYLIEQLNLDQASVYRGIEAQCLLARGASKKALFKKYWQEQQKSGFERSEYLHSLTPFERAQLCFKWTRTKTSAEEIHRQLRGTLEEMEKAFEKFYREHNTKQKKQKEQKSKRRQNKPEQTQAQTHSLQWAYDLLEMQATDEFSLIKKQFKRMAMKYHPDRLAREGLSEIECRRHHEHFVEVQRAYKALEKHCQDTAA